MRWIGLVPVVAGVAINLVADEALQRARTPVRPDEKPRALVTHGAYGISRNPMYLGFLLILLGTAILLGSLTPFLPVPVFALAMRVMFIQREEHLLGETFGGQWEEYRRAVRRWI